MESSTARGAAGAFDVLLQEIEAAVCLADQAGAQAFEKRDYEQARRALERAGKLAELRSKVMALRLSWEEAVGFPAEPRPKVAEEPVAFVSGQAQETQDLTTAEAIRDGCLARLERHFKVSLVKKKRTTTYLVAPGDGAVVLLVSKHYDDTADPRFWFGFHDYHDEFLASAGEGYLALSCGSPDHVLLIPAATFAKWRDTLGTSERGGGVYWHIHLVKREDRFYLMQKRDGKDVDLTQYLVR